MGCALFWVVAWLLKPSGWEHYQVAAPSVGAMMCRRFATSAHHCTNTGNNLWCLLRLGTTQRSQSRRAARWYTLSQRWFNVYSNTKSALVHCLCSLGASCGNVYYHTCIITEGWGRFISWGAHCLILLGTNSCVEFDGNFFYEFFTNCNNWYGHYFQLQILEKLNNFRWLYALYVYIKIDACHLQFGAYLANPVESCKTWINKLQNVLSGFSSGMEKV